MTLNIQELKNKKIYIYNNYTVILVVISKHSTVQKELIRDLHDGVI